LFLPEKFIFLKPLLIEKKHEIWLHFETFLISRWLVKWIAINL